MEAEASFSTAAETLDSGDVARLQRLLKSNPELATATDAGNAALLIRLIDRPGNRPLATDSATAQQLRCGRGSASKRRERDPIIDMRSTMSRVWSTLDSRPRRQSARVASSSANTKFAGIWTFPATIH